VSGQFKGKIGWAPVTVVSPVPGTSHKTAQTGAEKGKTEIQRTIELPSREGTHSKRLQPGGSGFCVFPSPSKIPYDGFSPVRLQTEIHPPPSPPQPRLSAARMPPAAALISG
jgi:hypothetical protein